MLKVKVYQKVRYCFKMLEEVFSLPPTQVGFIPLLLFEGVSLDLSRMFRFHQNITQKFLKIF